MKYTSLAIAILLALSVNAQERTQNVKGQILDDDSKVPAIGATVIVIGSDPLMGTVTDVEGYFKLENIAVGRVDLKIDYLGYESRTMTNILVNSGKETFLKIGIKESLVQLDAIEIQAVKDKIEVLNDMSLVSSRMFSTEETQRYAGSLNDPARMVASFAGVSGSAEGNNDIVVRGNSPKGILWRLEGIEIPNPNHFSDEGSTGGPINALNSAMLSNSDFLTGAFAPEYGNATSGVFDMKLRQGNSDKKEYSFGLGVMGTDFTLEGPFKNGKKASYLVNYRYSTLGLLDDAGIVDFGGVPRYQDASFKLFFPTKNAGTFSLFGLGGISSITETMDDTIVGASPLAISVYRANMGVTGLNHVYLINDKSYLKSAVSVSSNGSGNDYSERNEKDEYVEIWKARLSKYSTKALTTLNHKFNAKTKLTTGVIYTHQFYSFFTEYVDADSILVRPQDESGDAGYFQAFTSLKHRFTENITFVGGLHYLNFALNGSQSLEPRLAMNWKLNDKNSVNIGYGRHSRVESLLNYLAKVSLDNGEIGTPNKDLKLPKADHVVLGYGHRFNKNLHIKLEAYYQYLSDVPVEDDPLSSYSLVNQNDWYTDRSLVNAGNGENYGLELTLERFFADNFYYLFTGSLYKSQYMALDEVWRNSRFDGSYNSNFLLGKEFQIGDRAKKKSLSCNIKATLLGGNRYTPIDLDASILAQGTVRDMTRPYGAKGDDVFLINIGGSYKINRPKATHEIKFEILNATNNKASVREYYDSVNEEIVHSTQLPLIPNLIYTVQF